ncbi:MAG: biopolymer transporter ExbD [Candidatus Sulfotelmatobacter sp.]
MRSTRSNSLKSLLCRIDVTAFAGVMFALVAMFLLPAEIVVDFRGPSADLTKISHPIPLPAALREDALEVAITRDGKLYLGRDQIRLERLPAEIEERVRHGAERRVYIRADMRARYGTVKQVLDSVRSAGIEHIAFFVDQSQSGQRDHL